jgi:hypothetical protein
MHVLIGLITALAGLVWALYSLQRAGFDLNPAGWGRRRQWRKLYGTKPIFTLQRPMEAAALLMVGVLKQEGEISREQKAALVEIFRETFHLDEAQAQDVFASSVFLLKDELNLDQSVRGILAPTRERFTPEQAASLIALLERVARLEGAPNDAQQRIIDAARQELDAVDRLPADWH